MEATAADNAPTTVDAGTTIVVYGASDDLIEVEGGIDEEFSYIGEHNGEDVGDLLAFSDGTVIRIRYGHVWRIELVQYGTNFVDIEHCPENDDNRYSDRCTIHGPAPIRWVVQGVAVAMAGAR